ncbi:restriction endonuclease subunit S [Nocardia sp. CNY236]|uniref:restriction endonuclease subunit S n=1 Tax=Nocardia sp. CNY236 TaxID=1169152 RepID=UPI00040AB1B8|nr:restriction endonuclease subunit S [Nocardia sp. CNY236]
MTVYHSVPIGDVTTVRGGGTPTRSNADYYGGGIPWVTPKDMKSWSIDQSQVTLSEFGVQNSPAKLIPENSVLVVVRSGVLKHTIPVGINKVPVTINQDMKAIICDDSILPEYLARFIKERSGVILKWVRATTADNFPFDALRSLPIPLPPFNQQRRIAEILDQADALRAKRRQAITLLDELTQSLFIDMFGDSHTIATRWGTRPAEEVCSHVVDCINRTAPIVDYPTIYKMIRTTNVKNGEVNLTDVKCVSEKVFRQWNRRLTPQQGDVLLTREAPVGESGIIETNDNIFLGQRLMLYRANNSIVTSEYLLAAFRSSFLAHQFARHGSGSTVKHLPLPACRSFEIPTPPLDLQSKFTDAMRTIRALKQQHRMQIVAHDILFASLQSRAFRGELWHTDLDHLEGEGLS